jgi:cytoskeletal protein RodZ
VTTAAERGSGDFGSMLKVAREKRGVTLRHISSVTKISVAALEALERNDISRLPGGIFSRSFVRSYALEVGLDPDETIERFIAQFPEAAPPPGHAQAEQQEEEEEHDSNQQTAVTFVRLVVISVPIVAGLLYLGTMTRRAVAPPGAPAPNRPELVAAAPTPPAPPAVETAVPAVSSGSTTRAPERSTASAAPTPGPTAPGDTTGVGGTAVDSDRVTVAVVATAPCWVSAIVDGERVVSRQFQTGERMAFEVGRSVVLTAGDAAALAVTLNGEEARPLGSAGQVVTVRVTPANFKEYLVAP